MSQFTVQEKFNKTTEMMKSRFIALLFPLSDATAFKKMLNDIIDEYPKAKHYVYAYRVGQVSKSCDDKEPKGTAGRPLLELLHKRNLNNVALVVVRYYGGVQLGASRLLRTYVASGVNVINESKFIEIQ